MKPTRCLVPALLSCALMIGCGSRQPAQPVAQQTPQQPLAQTAQPLVGGQPGAVQQQAAVPAQGSPAAMPYPAQQPPAAPQYTAPPPNNAPAQYAAPQNAAPAQYQRVPSSAPASYPASTRRVAPERESARPPLETISIPAGTSIDVRLLQTIDTKRNRAGDPFEATLSHGIVVDEQTVVPRGTHFTGHLIESKPSGRLKGHAELSLSLDSFELNGRHYEIRTTHVGRASGGHKKRNWTLIGGGSGLGTALGAIAGGPAGALIGAGAGGGAGTLGAVFTGKKNVRLPVETPLAFMLRAPVTMAN